MKKLYQVNVRLGPSIDSTPRQRSFYIIAYTAQDALLRLGEFMRDKVSSRWEYDIERLDVLRLHGVLQ